LDGGDHGQSFAGCRFYATMAGHDGPILIDHDRAYKAELPNAGAQLLDLTGRTGSRVTRNRMQLRERSHLYLWLESRRQRLDVRTAWPSLADNLLDFILVRRLTLWDFLDRHLCLLRFSAPTSDAPIRRKYLEAFLSQIFLPGWRAGAARAFSCGARGRAVPAGQRITASTHSAAARSGTHRAEVQARRIADRVRPIASNKKPPPQGRRRGATTGPDFFMQEAAAEAKIEIFRSSGFTVGVPRPLDRSQQDAPPSSGVKSTTTLQSKGNGVGDKRDVLISSITAPHSTRVQLVAMSDGVESEAGRA
jgi:hypothetical protein